MILNLKTGIAFCSLLLGISSRSIGSAEEKDEFLSGVFQKRKDKQEAISYFSQIFGPDVIIEKIAYDADSQLLSFRLMAADIFTLEKVFELLSTQQSTQKFSSLTKSSLKRTNSGIYQMQITVVMGEEK